ncbi:MAG: hypothetical protein KIS66_11810 [Fimbriimonadaceae bacterium]|nr:hypothetical protein [Fimbriimonadaceae bacterium]
MDGPKKVFSEQEAAQIVQRAVHLQESASEGRGYVPGITYDELRRIAEEAGIDSRFLDQAVREGNAPVSHRGLLHFTETFERVIEGELAPEDFDVVMEHLHTGGRNSQVMQIGRMLKGNTYTGWGMASIAVASRNGRTRLSVKSNAFVAFFVSLYPAIIGSVIAASAMGERGLVAQGLGVAACLLATGAIGFRAMLRMNHKAARALTDRLETKIADESAALRERLARVPTTVPDDHAVTQDLGQAL